MGLVGISRSHCQHCAYQTTAGTMRSAELKPELPAYLFPPPLSHQHAPQLTREEIHTERNEYISEQQGAGTPHTSAETLEDDEFGDDDFKDQDVMNASKIPSSTVVSVHSTDVVFSQRDGLQSHRRIRS